ncbi:unnamed protein product [Echinostoma caproni]|uniref:E3 ubiquitin-protein ligase CHIP n=1 Tax=Echinostoma caproni TaxID=27848 RepID=A0A183ANB5_9TREM|nr:unnamed protein product [Echinostoma caproni]
MDNIDISHLPHSTLKDIGNGMFAAARYREAAQYYTEAILKQPDISSYYSNRALCYVQMQDYAKALPDCRRSIELDESNLKAYFFAGQAHLGLGQWEEALAKLLHAHNLALEQHRNFGDDITSVIRLAKRKRFEAEDEKRRQEEIALQTYLNNLILQDAERQKQALIQATQGGSTLTRGCIQSPACPQLDVQAQLETDPLLPVVLPDDPLHPADNLSSVPCSETLSVTPTATATTADDDVVREGGLTVVDERRQKREVPEYLCGRISFELMLDPVITPSGITYDKRSIIAHLRKVGHFDPLTRQPLTENQLIPNLSMKEVVHAFLEENPWAENY